jgi:hypothetical protein
VNISQSSAGGAECALTIRAAKTNNNMRLLFLMPLLFSTLNVLPATDGTYYSPLLPLEVGNHWVYRDASSGQEFTVSVGTPLFAQGNVYVRLTGFVDRPLWVRVTSENVLVYYDEEAERDRILLSFESGNFWFDAPFRGCEQLGQTRPERPRYEGPAGRYQYSTELVYKDIPCQSEGVRRELYTENIGMLSRTIETPDGPRTFELVRASIGAQSVGGDETGSFEVSVKPPQSTDSSLKATLRLTNWTAEVLKLPFRTAQRFDIVLRDDQSRELWKWSDGQFFQESLIDVLFQGRGEMTWKAEVPLPPTIDPTKDRLYTVEAWLTTVEGQARHAAAVPVRIRATIPPQ